MPADTRRVNLAELGQSEQTLSSRIDWPDQYRPLDPVFAVPAVDDDPVVAETMALVETLAPLVDEYSADALNAWLDEHLPGWAARTDFETLRRLDVQRTLIAELTQNYAVIAARLTAQRALVAELESVVASADRVLAGPTDVLADPAQPAGAVPVAAAPLKLPDRLAFGHPALANPGAEQRPPGPDAAGVAHLHAQPVKSAARVDTEGEVA